MLPIYTLTFVLGLILGSFLNACIWRTKNQKRVTRGRSQCIHCDIQIRAIDNIPVLSYVLLCGKCRECKGKIPISYLLVELWMGLAFLFVLIYHILNPSDTILLHSLRDMYIIWLLSYIFVYDLLYMEVLDSVTLAGAALIFITSLIYGWNTWTNMLFAAVIGSGFFLFQFVVSKGKWIGGGDIRIGLLMGIILGWPKIILGLFLAYIIGAVISVLLILLRKRHLADKTAFGTYLTLATFIAMFWGTSIIEWYLGLVGF